MIPKVIHYCWFGHNPMPKMLQKCMKSWSKYCAGYKVIEWNEDNVDLSLMPKYVQDAYDAKKWAFVTDYVRLWVIYTHGGIYLDTDVELIRPINDLLTHKGFFAFESNDFKTVATGLGFGAEKGLDILADLMKSYETLKFTTPDNKDEFLPNTWINWPVFEEHGVKKTDSIQIIDDGVVIYPGEYFDPMDGYLREKINVTPNTYSIHHYSMTWENNHEKKIKQIKRYNSIVKIKRFVHGVLGDKFYLGIKRLVGKH